MLFVIVYYYYYIRLTAFFQYNLGKRATERQAVLDFTGARDDGWQWHQLDHMQIICILLQTDNHASTSPLRFLQAGCSSWCQTNSVKAMKVSTTECLCFTT